MTCFFLDFFYTGSMANINLPFKNFSFKEKQVKGVSVALGTIVALLVFVLGFRIVADNLFARASDIKPKNLAIVEIQKNSAKIRWSSDTESQSVVEYGTSPTSLTFFAPEAVKTKEHSVELNLLTTSTTYYFQVRTGDKIFDNEGVPWTFTTLGKEAVEPTKTVEQNKQIMLSGTPSISSPVPQTSTNPENNSPTGAESTKDTRCDLKEYQNYYGQNIPKYDQDNNGLVNFYDWSLCRGKNGTLAPTSSAGAANTPLEERTLSSLSSSDGYILSNNNSTGSVDANSELQIGRSSTGVARSFLNFDLSSLPSNIVIEEATLKVYQTRTTGLPFSLNKSLIIDSYAYGNTLDSDDFNKTATDVLISKQIGTINNQSNDQYKEITVTKAVQDDFLAKRSLSGFRIQFLDLSNAGGDTDGDFVYFESGNNSANTGKTPELLVRYRQTS